MSEKQIDPGFGTRAVHTGVNIDDGFNSVTTPIYPSSTFYFDRIGVNKGYDYTRSGNPTRSAVEKNIALLEGGAGARCTSTGMSASLAVLHLLRAGDHVIAGHDIYGGTYRLMASLFSQLGVEFSFVNLQDAGQLKVKLRDNTRMIWIETPSNPLLYLTDLEETARIASEHGVITVADNTFMSPYFQRPLEFGVDIVVHSTTKYINGHSDVVGGAVVCRTPELLEQIGFRVNALGIGESPFDAWLVLRGVKTLGLRMEQHQRNAVAIAGFLNSHPAVKRVYFPGLKDHPQHELAKRQMSGWGGMVSFELDSARVPLDDFFARLEYYSLAESLGGVESLIEPPWYMSHASMPETARREAGMSPETIRMSLGIEDTDDLIRDLDNGLRS